MSEQDTQPQKMTNEEVERLLSYEMTRALQYVYGPDNIAAERDRNYDYYRGIMSDLPTAKGRSSVVIPTIANYTGLMKPSLLRIFTASRNIGEYVSPKDEAQDTVRLVTRYINDVVIRKDNRGEMLLSDWADDGLVQKMGTIKGWWEERYETKDEILQDIPDQVFVPMALEIQKSGAEIVEHTASQGQTPQGLMAVHTIKVRRKVNKSQLCIDALPPEEYVISRDARNDNDPVLEGHRTGKMVGEIIPMGYDPVVVQALPDYATAYPDRMQKYNQTQTQDISNSASPDPMLRKKGLFQGILRCNYDGTGIKEWYVVAGGTEAAPKLLEIDEYQAQVWFANFCPEPRPHTVYGSCPADRLAVNQRADTVLARGMLDSLYLAITPQREVVMDWIIRPDQLMNLSPGAPVLVKQPNAIREIAIPFVGEQALKGIAYFESQSEITTGVSRATGGLDPDTLQNQSATAAANQRSAMDGRVEMIARVWAQGGMRKLFRMALQTIITYQDFERVVQIDGSAQTISPEMFKGLDDIEVNINTGLGTGNRERDYMMLSGILTIQKEFLERAGDNPVVGVDKVVKTLQLMCESAGVSYPENFFGNPINPDGSPWTGPQPPPPQPTPDAVLFAQTEDKKIEEKATADSNQLQLDREKCIAEIASRERIAMDKNAKDYEIGLRQLGIQHAQTIVQAAKVDAEMIRTDMLAGKAA